jgi:hypothetical protein
VDRKEFYQLTEKQARKRLDHMLEHTAKHGFSKTYQSYWREDGAYVWYSAKGRSPVEFQPIVSHIKYRCDDCNKVIVYRHNNAVAGICSNWYDSETDLRKRKSTYLTLCLGCSNKRRPIAVALSNWDDTRKHVNRTKLILTEANKENKNVN